MFESGIERGKKLSHTHIYKLELAKGFKFTPKNYKSRIWKIIFFSGLEKFSKLTPSQWNQKSAVECEYVYTYFSL